MKKKILIAGGAGFIGKNLSLRLVQNSNNFIYCLDNFITSDITSIRDIIRNHNNFELINHDVIEEYSIEVDEIYHLASAASPILYQKNPLQTIKSNIMGSFNLCELALKCKAKILFASTSEIYGDPLVHPQVENYYGNVNTVGPRSCYDEGKRCSETIFYEYKNTYNIRSKIIRIFNTYGPLMDTNDGRVISNFIMASLKNEEILINGDGKQTRSFCYIDDLIDGMLALMNSDIEDGPINIGNSHEMSIYEIAILIKEMCKSNSTISYCDLQKNDPIRRNPNIEKAKKSLGWSPKVSLEEGLFKTIEYFKKFI